MPTWEQNCGVDLEWVKGVTGKPILLIHNLRTYSNRRRRGSGSSKPHHLHTYIQMCFPDWNFGKWHSKPRAFLT